MGFWEVLITNVVLFGLFLLATRKWGWWLLDRSVATSLMKSEQAYARMTTTIDVLTEQIRAKDDQLAQMRLNSLDRDERIRELTQEIQRLEEVVTSLKLQLEQKQVIEKVDQPLRVLAIWPTPAGQPGLDQSAESDALYNAGYGYVALRGIYANRAGVILEIDRVRPDIIQIGGHGTGDGILLTDGNAEPGWWGQVVSGRNIQLILLLSCESSQQDEVNVSDALVRAGVQAVISCDAKIDDADAVKFTELLYAKLSEGLPLASATRRAKLGVSRNAAEMIRLREAHEPIR